MKPLLFAQTTPTGTRATTAAQAVSAILALALICSAALLAFQSLQYQWNWESVWRYRAKFAEGWLTTVGISIIALAVSIAIGGAAALASRSAFLPVRYLARIYVSTIRGTPLLAQVLIFYYVVADAAGLHNRYVVGTLVLAVFSGAYLSEIFRAGVESVGRTQLLSAKAIGLTRRQTFRFVVLPQALRQSLPALAGQFANLIKDSSLLSVIAISEFTLNAQEVNSATLSSFESLMPLAAGYLALTLPVMGMARVIEKRLRFET